MSIQKFGHKTSSKQQTEKEALPKILKSLFDNAESKANEMFAVNFSSYACGSIDRYCFTPKIEANNVTSLSHSPPVYKRQ